MVPTMRTMPTRSELEAFDLNDGGRFYGRGELGQYAGFAEGIALFAMRRSP